MLIFAEVLMSRILIFSIFTMIGCVQHAPTHPPVGGLLSEKDLINSRNRTKNLNITERQQIEEWIKSQDVHFYPMALNYWVSNENLVTTPRKENGREISFEYDIYDFNLVKLYDLPTKKSNVIFGRFEELKPVEDALRHMEKDQQVTLLIPSALGFGSYGDNDRIPNDMPLIIKLKAL